MSFAVTNFNSSQLSSIQSQKLEVTEKLVSSKNYELLGRMAWRVATLSALTFVGANLGYVPFLKPEISKNELLILFGFTIVSDICSLIFAEKAKALKAEAYSLSAIIDKKPLVMDPQPWRFFD